MCVLLRRGWGSRVSQGLALSGFNRRELKELEIVVGKVLLAVSCALLFTKYFSHITGVSAL